MLLLPSSECIYDPSQEPFVAVLILVTWQGRTLKELQALKSSGDSRNQRLDVVKSSMTNGVCSFGFSFPASIPLGVIGRDPTSFTLRDVTAGLRGMPGSSFHAV